MASQKHSSQSKRPTPTKTTPSSSSRELIKPMELERQYSYTTLARLIGAGDNQPSPAPSPVGAAQMKNVVQRLEEIDRESRELLQTVFSMIEKDARLERYVKRGLEDPKVSRMWELVEEIISSHHGHVDLDAMATCSNSEDEEETELVVDKGLKVMEGGEMRMDRFKIRTLDAADDVVVEEGHPRKTP